MKQGLKSGLIGGAAVLALAAGVIGFAPFLLPQRASLDYTEWMKGVTDETAIRSLNIPGSHDTMALHSIANLSGQCQTLSLGDQLKLGIRFLDIRLKEEHNELKAVHGFIDQRVPFRSIAAEVSTFLRLHPSEFVIMSIKEEAASSSSTISFEDALKKVVDPGAWYTGSAVPSKVGEVRGKVVLLSRYANSTMGIPAYANWKDSCSFLMEDTGIYVQDYYKIGNIEDKKKEIVSCFNEAGHSLKINFLSGYKSSGFPPSYAPSVANDINAWIDQSVSTYEDRGVVLYDFVTSRGMQAFFGGAKK